MQVAPTSECSPSQRERPSGDTLLPPVFLAAHPVGSFALTPSPDLIFSRCVLTLYSQPSQLKSEVSPAGCFLITSFPGVNFCFLLGLGVPELKRDTKFLLKLTRVNVYTLLCQARGTHFPEDTAQGTFSSEATLVRPGQRPRHGRAFTLAQVFRAAPSPILYSSAKGFKVISIPTK